MEVFAIFAFVFVGIVAGLIAGLLGLSGGVVTVPCLLFIFHFLDFPQAQLMHMAIGTSLSAMVITGIASSWAHHLHKGVMWAVALKMLPGIIVGCLLGSFIAQFLSGVILQIIFGFFVCSLGAYIIFKKKKTPSPSREKPHNTLYSWIGMGIGTVASMLGIGGGVFMVPLLISYRFSEQKAIGTSAATGLMITSMAALSYLYFGMDVITVPMSLGYIYLPAFALVSVGTVIFAPIGAKMAHKMDGAKLRKIFAGTLIIVGVLMILN